MTNAVAVQSALQEWRPVDWPDGWVMRSWQVELDSGRLYTRVTAYVEAVWLPKVPTPGSGTEVGITLRHPDEWPYLREQLVAFGELLTAHRWHLDVRPARW